MKKKKVLILFSCLFLIGCATGRNPLSRDQLGSEPKFDVVTQADVGGVIYAEYQYTRQEGARLPNKFSIPYGFGHIEIESGYVLAGFINGSTREYCTPDRTYYDQVFGPYDIVCFSSKGDDANAFDMIRVPSLLMGDWFAIDKIEYQKTDFPGNKKGHRMELIYRGISNQTVNLTYREYKDDFARPASQEEIASELDPKRSTLIDFKGAEIDVMQASGSKITYRIKRGFGK
jgi:hypothetical protein